MPMNHSAYLIRVIRTGTWTYGAMMTLAPSKGRLAIVWPSDCGPMHLTGFLTSFSHPSSCELSWSFEAVYHEPAWLGSLTISLLDMVDTFRERRNRIKCTCNCACDLRSAFEVDDEQEVTLTWGLRLQAAQAVSSLHRVALASRPPIDDTLACCALYRGSGQHLSNTRFYSRIPILPYNDCQYGFETQAIHPIHLFTSIRHQHDNRRQLRRDFSHTFLLSAAKANISSSSPTTKANMVMANL